MWSDRSKPVGEQHLNASRGWSSTARFVDEYPHLGELQRELKQLGMTMITKFDASTPEHASLTIAIHDGSTILVDQHP